MNLEPTQNLQKEILVKTLRCKTLFGILIEDKSRHTKARRRCEFHLNKGLRENLQQKRLDWDCVVMSRKT